MRRLCRSVTGIALLATLALGCGSTSGDSVVLIFQGFSGTGITQSDQVGSTSASVDSVQTQCTESPTTFEPFTPTLINAIFRNQEGLDIQLESYTLHFNLPPGLSGPKDFSFPQSGTIGTIRGGRCSSNSSQSCATDADCITSGSEGSTSGTCDHLPTSLEVQLFSTQVKSSVDQQIFGQTTPLTITFYGTDATNRSFETTAAYSVIFDNFDNCSEVIGGGAGGS